MRMTTLAALGLVAATAYPNAAMAAQDTPYTINGVEAVCTGVGSAKDDPRWSAYPVKLVFNNTAGENLATEHVTLTQKGQTVMATECDAPWLLINAPAGDYDVAATIEGRAGTRNAQAHFSSGGAGGQKVVTLEFPPSSGSTP